MAGISSAGCYVPPTRLPLTLLAGRTPREGDPERSMAWYDEDSVTMGVAAARDCLRGRSDNKIDLVIFATTTHAFEEKQGAVIIARALGLPTAVRTVDIGHSLRSGTQALSSALDAVEAGTAREALVVVADCRMGAPGSDLERNGGDAAVAFLLNRQGGLAEFVGSVHCSEEIVDVWRRSGDRFTHQWEERFVQQHGYLAPAMTAARALREKFPQTAAPGSSLTWILSAADARSHATLAARLELDKAAVRTPLFGRVGYCGAAHALLQLSGALGESGPNKYLGVVNHGDGAEALLFETRADDANPQQVGALSSPTGSEQVATESLAERLEIILSRRIGVTSLEQFRRARDLTIPEYSSPDEQGISATVHFRERDEDLALIGQRCSCGAAQFPKGRICAGCGRTDQWRPEKFAECTGRLVTFTLDAFYPSPEPPTVVVIVQVENGPRIHMQMADIAPNDVRVDMPLRFAFRCIHRVGRRPNYFWKCVPVAANWYGQP
jgi:3-hydroxy-3-methylglutaryl CoA synthase/uncharacterized OB-fold protein